MCSVRAEFLQKFYSRVEAVSGAIDFFDASLWRTLIEKATVHHDGRIIFKFLDGTEIERNRPHPQPYTRERKRSKIELRAKIAERS